MSGGLNSTEGRGYGPDAQDIPETALEGLGVARRQNAAEPAVNADPVAHNGLWMRQKLQAGLAKAAGAGDRKDGAPVLKKS